MKKFLLALVLSISGIIAANAWEATLVTSCGVEIDMIYEDYHSVHDAVHDLIILEDYFCN
ncbi:MAG: hypothetical protein LBT43_02215 [Prevotella sp.]|jgi:hypothetical protein|nr:hypothetical protein [Prevotella sp.]